MDRRDKRPTCARIRGRNKYWSWAWSKAWVCRAASSADTLVIIDDVTANAAERILKCIRPCYLQDNGPKHASEATQDFLRGKEWEWPSRSSHLDPNERVFFSLKAKRHKNKQELKIKVFLIVYRNKVCKTLNETLMNKKRKRKKNNYNNDTYYY